MNRLVCISALIICLFSQISNNYASDKGIKKQTSSASPYTYSKLNLNNISTWIYNNGSTDMDLNFNSGYVHPRGSGKTAVYESGLIWGGKINGQIRVGGSTYYHGLQRGKILSKDFPDDTNLVKNRVYRVRPDYKTADFTIEASEEGKTQSEIYRQYERDWKEWPAEDGAPYQDINGDGKYDPYVDIPGIKDAIQTLWYVANDLNSLLTTGLYGSQPMGIEMQATFWTYNRDFFLNNTYFRKYKLINKSGNEFNDMYIGMWVDPDLGDAMDDLVGCDTTLNLGLTYNGFTNDAFYGPKPPALGFDLLEGPLVKGSAGKDLNKNGIDDAEDYAFYNGRKTAQGYINLPMTAFSYFVNNDPALTDPTPGSYDGTYQMYNFLQGKIGKTGEYFRNPQGKPTSLALTGDPYKNSGWLDGVTIPSGDRRFLLSAGPFSMAAGDTQEVAFSVMSVIGNDRLHSVYLLKEYDKKIKQYFIESFNFRNIPSPEAPLVRAGYTSKGISLEWTEDPQIEGFSKDGFTFEGYNIYQLPNGIPDKKNAVKIAAFDVKNGIRSIYGRELDSLNLEIVYKLQQEGNDTGIQRSLAISRDSLWHCEFLIGKKYYFALSAYTYRADSSGNLTNSESPLRVVSVVFQDSLPGLKYMDTLKVKRVSGSSDKMVSVVVIDPSKITGHDYEVGFENYNNIRTCYLRDIYLNKYLTRDLGSVVLENPAYPGPVFDGISIIVHDPPAGMGNYQIPSGELKWSPVYGNAYGLEGFSGAIGKAYDRWFSSSTITVENLFNTLIKFASTDSLGNLLDPNDVNASYAYRYVRLAANPPAKPEFRQYIINPSKGYAYQDYTKTLPFSAYNAVTGQRLMVGYLENNAINGRVDGKYWPPASDEKLDNISSTGPREWFFIFNVKYDTNPAAELQTDISNNTTPMLWYGTPTRKGATSTAFTNTDQFLILKSNLFTTDDKFTFKTDYLTSVKTESAPVKFGLSQNYPNPFNPKTQIEFSLAEKGIVTLRVFNILGQIVQELVNKELSAGVHKVEFNGEHLASGIYIYRLDVKDKFSNVKKMVILK